MRTRNVHLRKETVSSSEAVGLVVTNMSISPLDRWARERWGRGTVFPGAHFHEREDAQIQGNKLEIHPTNKGHAMRVRTWEHKMVFP